LICKTISDLASVVQEKSVGFAIPNFSSSLFIVVVCLQRKLGEIVLQVNLLGSWVVGCQQMETNNGTVVED
jgi:hypothetical protein